MLDGAMGTMLQHHGFTEEDRRGARFADHRNDLERTLFRRLMPSGDWRDWPAIGAWARDTGRDPVPPTA